MRITHLLRSGLTNGAGTSRIRLIAALAEAGLSQHVVLAPYPALEQKLDEASIPYTVAKSDGLVSALFGSRRVMRALARFRPHILMIDGAQRIRWKTAGECAIVAVYDGGDKLMSPQAIDQLICSSPAAMDRAAARGWPEQRLSVLTNYSLAAAGDAHAREKENTPPEARIIYAAANEENAEPVLTAIGAISHLPDTYYLWVSAPSKLAPDIRKAAADMGAANRVRLIDAGVGRIAALKAADMAVLTDDADNTAAVLDAWKLARPVIVPGDAKDAERLVRCGVNALITARGDAVALADAVIRIAKNPDIAETLIKGGKRAFNESHARDVVTRGYIGVFNAAFIQKVGRPPEPRD